MEHQIFFQAFIYLLAAVITVPIALRMGFGSVLGYLIAGVIIGPFALKLVSTHTNDIMHFAEFGVVMMLFLVGLELRPSMLWQMRKSLLFTGGLQVILTAIVIFLIAKFCGVNTATSIAIGLIFTASSTAIVLQMLQEKGVVKSEVGNRIFAILLFQDIAVIPMLAIFPILGVDSQAVSNHQNIDGWIRAVLIIVLLSAIVLGGRYLLRPVFKFIASSKLNEAFTALALLLVVGTTLGMSYVGLSPAMGAFIAGVVLAESEYRHELEADIEPFKGLLLGLFFISVGTNIDFNVIHDNFVLIMAMVFGLVFVKFIVLFTLGKIYNRQTKDIWLVSLILAQGGEFCFVLISYAGQYQLFTSELSRELVAVVALSMVVTPLAMIVYDKVILKLLVSNNNSKDFIAQNQDHKVIVAGFGRFGQIVSRFLLANGITSTILDIDAKHIETARRFGYKVFYGDVSRLDILHLAGIESAQLLVIAIDDGMKAIVSATKVRHKYPHIKILIRVRNRIEAYEAVNSGFSLDEIFRETFDTAVNVAVKSLESFGCSIDDAEYAAKLFREFDEKQLYNMSSRYKGKVDEDYIKQAKINNEQLENILNNDLRKRI